MMPSKTGPFGHLGEDPNLKPMQWFLALWGNKNRNPIPASSLPQWDVTKGIFQCLTCLVGRNRPLPQCLPLRPRPRNLHLMRALVDRIAAGDKLAMQALFVRHRTPVYRWLLRFVSNQTLAEDLLSEVSSTCGGRLIASRVAPQSRLG